MREGGQSANTPNFIYTYLAHQNETPNIANDVLAIPSACPIIG